MIRYALTCKNAHSFDSWFASAGAYDALHGAGHVSCPACGSVEVQKSLMAPAVTPARKKAYPMQAAQAAPNPDPQRAGRTGVSVPAGQADTNRPLSQPQSEVETALAALRAQIEANSDYVGMNFAREARAIHDGTAPDRSIYGEARPEDARALLEDGIKVAPLPFMPPRKTN
jgi:hypothetical protein